jgi:lipopolysaccharide cholinephosphotransferase
MNLEPIHKTELNLLDIFISLCRQFHLTYFLIGGSMLGAVRHHGFIPWDDDLDVGMPRADYNQFLKLAPVTLGHTSYFLQTPFTDKDYGLSYAKLLDLDTEIEEFNNVNQAKKGIFMDIFPLDGIPAAASERTSQITKLKFYDSSILLRLGYHLLDSPLNDMFKPLTVNQYNQVRQLKRKRDNVLQQFNSSDHTEVKNLASQYKYEKEIMAVSDMTDLISVEFEHYNVNIPRRYDLLLTQLYGDYRQLPPAKNQTNKHFKKVVIDGQELN